ncbi:hypothetical protein BV20DRAFT_972041 [Pilatotrama ljubarskyi]|nr:hypothetical protein BV20DRAFT_972041 [Pilatotrama ljubarskyi]
MQNQVTNLRHSVAQAEQRLHNLQVQQQQQQQMGSAGNEQLDKEILKLQEEIATRNTTLMRIHDMLRQTAAHRSNTGGQMPNPMNMNPMATSPVPPQRVASAMQNPAQVGWMQQSGSSPANQFSSPRQMPTGAHPMQNGTPQQPNLQMSTPQLPPQMQQGQHMRTVTTPLQILNAGVGPSGPQTGPQPAQNGMPNAFANAGAGAPGGQPAQGSQPSQQQHLQQQQQQQQPMGFRLSPMSQEHFSAVYKNWLARNPKDLSLLQCETQMIDLWKLHCEVIKAGGAHRVTTSDSWPIIGARLGFVNIPATETEPARAGPALAHRVQSVYKEFLFAFDRQYHMAMLRKQQQLVAQQKQLAGGNMDNGLQGMNRPPVAPNAPASRPLSEIDPKLLNELVNYSVQPVAELQRQGVPPHIIQLVEQHRVKLREVHDSQNYFGNNIRNANGGEGIAQNGQNRPAGVAQLLPRNVSNPGMVGEMPNIGHPNPPQNGMPQLNNNRIPQPTATIQPGMGGGQAPGMMRPMRPSPAQQQQALEMLMKVRNESKARSFANRPPVTVPDTQRLEYNAIFEQLHRAITELDNNLHHYACVMKEDAIRQLVNMVAAVQQQRELLSGNAPRYFMSLDSIKMMMKQVQAAAEAFKNYVANMSNGASMPPAQPGAPGQPGPSMLQRPPTMQIQQPPVVPSLPPGPPPSKAVVAPHSVPTPIQKKPTPKPQAESPSAPTPAAATPATGAPTPTHMSSPQTPKSPRNKPAPKPKQPPKPRRVSAKPPPATPTAVPASPAAGPSETKPPATPAAPASAPTPDASAGSKRPREEEPAAPSSSAAAQPAAKKIKTDWDEPPSDTLTKRQEQADAVKTDEDAIKFIEQMSNWLSQVEGDGQDSLKSEIADSLGEILKAYPDVPDDGGLSSLAGSSWLDSITVGSASPKQGATTVDPSDFFDFTSYDLPEEDGGSKAATPDLVQASSSVGPSPGSASETEAHPPASSGTDTAKIADPKSEASEGDAIPQELWRAFDGGESAFYNASDAWKWDQPMPAQDQPWAFYSS